MARTAVLALAFLALMAGPAQGSAPTGTTAFEVVVVPDFTVDDLAAVQGLGAVGLLNPGAGPETSAGLAEAALVRGEVRSCFSMTEPEHPGSNPTWMSTTAVKDGDCYVINGHKWFTSSADGANAGSRARASWMNSATVGDPWSWWCCWSSASTGSASGVSSQMRSARSRNGSRLVTSTTSRGAVASRSAIKGAASRTCS